MDDGLIRLGRWAGLLAAVVVGCARPAPPPAQPPPAPRVALFLGGDVRGQLGPCGCSEAMRGGLPRAASLVDTARKEGLPVALLDAGDLVFPAATLSEAQVPGEERKALALAEGLRRMGLVAVARGERDGARGKVFADGLGLPWLGEGESRLLEVGGRKLGVVAGTSREALASGAARLSGLGAAYTVALVHAPWAEAVKLAAAGTGVDLVLVDHGGEGPSEENRLLRGDVPVLQLQDRGRSLGRVDLHFGGAGRFQLAAGEADRDRELAALDGRVELLRAQLDAPGIADGLKRLRAAKLEEVISRRAAAANRPVALPTGVNAATVRLLPVEPTLPESPAVAEVVAAYDRDVGALNLAWAKGHGAACPEPGPGESGYAGSGACQDCHDEAWSTWQKTKHARAFTALEEKQKSLHLECVGCHVTGWQRPGGVCRLDALAAESHGVGCESCHGPGARHAESPEKVKLSAKVAEATCRGCHDRENSPHFDHGSYLPLVLGLGHGAR